jgi:rod shape determining protein RodA
LGIFCVGLLALSSAASGTFLIKQIIFLFVAIVLVTLSYRLFDLSFFQNYATVIYFLNIGLLILLKVAGTSVLGSQRWLKLGPISIQPSEIAKICLIICLAAWLSKHPIRNYWDILKALALVAVPAMLVLIQPDLGTTLVYIAICFGMLFWAGARLMELFIMISPLVTAILSSIGLKLFEYHHDKIEFAITLPFLIFITALLLLTIIYYQAWRSPLASSAIFGLITCNLLVMLFKSIAWGLLKDYQQKRLTIFLDPYVDPLGAGYHIIQSLYAIGSGGLFGQGLMHGDLTQGNFVPEQHTDFIFSTIGEEFGFIGSILVVILYGILCTKIIHSAKTADDRFKSLIAIGTFSMLFFHIFVNIGMNLSIMPITGVPLPFFSYGGSSLVVDLFLVSLVVKASQSSRSSNSYRYS